MSRQRTKAQFNSSKVQPFNDEIGVRVLPVVPMVPVQQRQFHYSLVEGIEMKSQLGAFAPWREIIGYWRAERTLLSDLCGLGVLCGEIDFDSDRIKSPPAPLFQRGGTLTPS